MTKLTVIEGIGEAYQEKLLVRQSPALSKVEDWVKQAKELPRIVQY